MSAIVPPLIYLDSSDYSMLSDPSRETEANVRTREELLDLARTKQANFVFSGVHLSEMAPLAATYSSAANSRADLLVELCGRNCFIAFDRLLKVELGRLIDSDRLLEEVLSGNAEWFPEPGEIISPFRREITAQEMDIAVREHGVNRQQRRKINRKLFKASGPKSEFSGWLASQDPKANLGEVLRLYPMRPEDAEIISAYVLGQVSASAAERAFLESLRDPRWMMRWFAENHDKMNAIADWLRAPAINMAAQMREVAANIQRLREEIGDENVLSREMSVQKWRSSADESLLRIARRLFEHFWPESQVDFGLIEVNRCCPGLSTAVRSLYSSVWDSFGANPRYPQESDFLDAVHSMYAPYVSFFRADRYMSPHIQRQVARHGTLVVNRIADLPSKLLNFRSASSAGFG